MHCSMNVASCSLAKYLKTPAIKLLLVGFAAVGVAGLAGPAAADPLDAVTDAIGGGIAKKTVGQVITDLHQKADDLRAKADASANARLSQAAQEAEALANALSAIYKNRLDETMGAIDQREFKVFQDIDARVSQLAKIGAGAYDMLDTTSVTISEYLDRLPAALVDKAGFFVQAVRGLAILPTPGDKSLVVTASHLGIRDDFATDISATISGVPVKVTVDQASHRDQATITVPEGELRPRFDEQQLVKVPMVLTFTTHVPHSLLGLVHWRTAETHQVPVDLLLYPKVVASVQPVAVVHAYEWKSAERVTITSGPTPDRHCSGHCGGEPTRGSNGPFAYPTLAGGAEPSPGEMRYVDGSLDAKCIGRPEGCAFAGAFSMQLVGLNRKSASVRFDTWGHSSEFALSVATERYTEVSAAPWAGSKVKVGYGESPTFDFPAGATDRKLIVTTYDGQVYEVPAGSNVASLSFHHESSDPRGYHATYSVALNALR